MDWDAVGFLVALCLWAVLVGAVLLAWLSWARLVRVLWVGYNDGKELSSLVWVLLVLFVRSFRRVLKTLLLYFSF